MSVEISIPFALDHNGSIAVTSDPDQQTLQHVESIVATQPGERVMIVDYGVPSENYLFEPYDDLLREQIVTDIQTTMDKYEPAIYVLSAVPSPDLGNPGNVPISVEYRTLSSLGIPTGPNKTALIMVGGRVIDL